MCRVNRSKSTEQLKKLGYDKLFRTVCMIRFQATSERYLLYRLYTPALNLIRALANYGVKENNTEPFYAWLLRNDESRRDLCWKQTKQL